MEPREIKGARTRLGLTQQEMAAIIGCETDSYSKKERGAIKFSDREKVLVARTLGLSYQQMNDYLFDGVLPTVSEENVVW